MFELLPGHRFDTVGIPPLIKGLAFDVLIAAKTFDSDAIMADLNERGAKVVISQHPRRAKRLVIDEQMYKWRHLIETLFCKLKEFKRIAMRSDGIDTLTSDGAGACASLGYETHILCAPSIST